jgi:hypothetical protein
MLPKRNLTIYFANWCNGEFESISSSGKFQWLSANQKTISRTGGISKQPCDEGHYDFCQWWGGRHSASQWRY